jgi:hypothetical protein
MTTQYISYKPGGSAGAGTVTSVGLVAPAIFAVSGSPVTGSGNLTLTLSTEVANTVWAGPTTGADAAPTFRSLVINDLPGSIPYSKLTLTNSIVNADIAPAAGITYSKLVLTGSIVNADVSASAAIALSKLAATTVSRALVSDGSGFVSPATTTATEIGYVNGVTSSIQTQLNAKDAVITFSTGLTRTVNTVTVNTSQNIATLSNLTTNGFVKTSGGTGALSVDTSTYITGNQTITLSGDVTGSGTTAITTTIGAARVTNAMLAGSIDMATKMTGTMQAAQFPALTGDMTTSAGALAVTAAATQPNITTLSKSTGVALHGTNTNNNAAAGYLGEYVESKNASFTNFPATGTYGDATSISLTAGDWDVTLLVDANANSSTNTAFSVGISTTSGNSSAGLSSGENAADGTFNNLSNSFSNGVSIPNYRMSLSGTTTVYGKIKASFTAGTPQYTYRLSARRVC